MALIELTEKLRPRELVLSVADELSTLKSHVESRGRVLQEIETLVTETNTAETQIAQAQKEVFSLQRTKLRAAQLAAVDEFANYVNGVIEAIEEKKAKKGGT